MWPPQPGQACRSGTSTRSRSGRGRADTLAIPRLQEIQPLQRTTPASFAGLEKKHDRGWGRPRMRYPGPEKLEVIRLVEQSHLPVRRTLRHLGIPPATFYRWYDRYRSGGPEALEDRPSRPDRVWNRIPDATREGIIDLA